MYTYIWLSKEPFDGADYMGQKHSREKHPSDQHGIIDHNLFSSERSMSSSGRLMRFLFCAEITPPSGYHREVAISDSNGVRIACRLGYYSTGEPGVPRPQLYLTRLLGRVTVRMTLLHEWGVSTGDRSHRKPV